MKNIIIPIKIGSVLLFFFLLNNPLQSQENSRGFSSSIRLNEINTHAFRHFRKNFSYVSNENWSKSESGYVVRYIHDDLVNQAFYDFQGNFMYDVKFVGEKDLDKEIISRVCKEFPGYVIDAINEVNGVDDSVYLFSLKNKMIVKNIMVTETEIKVIDYMLYSSR